MNRNRRPPALAAWILSRLLRGRRSEALVGDLDEEYGRGRTRVWYWRQALYAAAADMREHPPRRVGLVALWLLIDACLIVGTGLWPLLFAIPLDPILWHVLRRHKQRRDRKSPRSHAPCDR